MHRLFAFLMVLVVVSVVPLAHAGDLQPLSLEEYLQNLTLEDGIQELGGEERAEVRGLIKFAQVYLPGDVHAAGIKKNLFIRWNGTFYRIESETARHLAAFVSHGRKAAKSLYPDDGRSAQLLELRFFLRDQIKMMLEGAIENGTIVEVPRRNFPALLWSEIKERPEEQEEGQEKEDEQEKQPAGIIA